MCTAITYKTKQHYFGRNLDLEYSYRESVTITPRNYPFSFRMMGEMKSHYAMIGMAMVEKEYPLNYDATNEKGLSMAGLLFVGNAVYQNAAEGKENISPFEFIPWILGQCADLEEVRMRLAKINLTAIDFSPEYPLSQLHWMISDREGSIVVEAVKEGLRVYENPVEVLTNNPPFEIQMFELNKYMGLSAEQAENHFSEELRLENYSRGMGGLGLPGDWTSSSRFVRAAFVRMNAKSGETEEESVSQFFHILGSVEHPRGCVHMGNGKYEITVYSSCCNTDEGIYYYKTYDHPGIVGIDMKAENLDGCMLISYPMEKNGSLSIC